ncbi:MAG: queuine tRNA-ribosyltransferase [Anaerolineae bacterium SM23_ 63]|nr:MAG: queuine tRNA-ribosyltransferase [Anaerolineae bacterium SM23_ 63]
MDVGPVSTSFFELLATDGGGRAGIIHTPHGDLQTPLFAPVGTQATVKAITPEQLQQIGATLVLANAYHLYLRPGDERIAALGGLHEFMAWKGPILTDSGGFQIFSLTESRQVDSDGVTFRSHIDGSTHRLTPEKVIAIQENLGADIIMAFDECPEPLDRVYNEQAMIRTHNWAERCLAAKTRSDQVLFGIVQGGIFADLREQSASAIASMGFPGIAIGGLSVGESKQDMLAMLEIVGSVLPPDRPRYLMGVGFPQDLIEAVKRGIDMFDCVLPTRMARNHAALTRLGRLNMRNATFAEDVRPIDPDCKCYTCLTFTRAYLRHLIASGEMLAATLLTIHNLYTLVSLTADLRQAVIDGQLDQFSDQFLANDNKHRPPES